MNLHMLFLRYSSTFFVVFLWLILLSIVSYAQSQNTNEQYSSRHDDLGEWVEKGKLNHQHVRIKFSKPKIISKSTSDNAWAVALKLQTTILENGELFEGVKRLYIYVSEPELSSELLKIIGSIPELKSFNTQVITLDTSSHINIYDIKRDMVYVSFHVENNAKMSQ